MNTIARDDHGRYTIRLPFREANKRLGDSRAVALKRLLTLERRFSVDDVLKNEYTRIIDEYLKLNYISIVEHFDDDGYYMPHHAVIKESSNTTKVRIVFDASAKTGNKISLNDILGMVGPTIQNKLFAHLIRLRTYRFVISADIEKMYLQVVLHQDDRYFQRILWRKNDKIQTLQFNTLTFGVSSSPILAILYKLADDERHAFSKAAEILKKHLYVDDLLSGTDSINEARVIRDELIALLSRSGFTIRQWASNDERIINDLATSALHANFIFDKDRSLKTLGITWHVQDDQIRYYARAIKIERQIDKTKYIVRTFKDFRSAGIIKPHCVICQKAHAGFVAMSDRVGRIRSTRHIRNMVGIHSTI